MVQLYSSLGEIIANQWGFASESSTNDLIKSCNGDELLRFRANALGETFQDLL